MAEPPARTDSSSNAYRDPVGLLVRLLRFDTTNPPGGEAPLIRYVERLLRGAGIESVEIVAAEPGRPNLVARLRGEGAAAPLLLYGHVDVVGARSGEWTHPPFEGVRAGGHVWGRGALDMKGGLAQLLAAFLRARAEGTPLAGDVVLALVVDEEAGGCLGVRYLVEERPELFEDVRYAIGEFGGFALPIAGRRFYPIGVAEKQICRVRATVRGRVGHGAVPARGGAFARAGRLLSRLERRRLPVHVTPAAAELLAGIDEGFPGGGAVRPLLEARGTEAALNLLAASFGETGDALLRNTVSARVVRGGEESDPVGTGEVVLQLDGRLLPGQGPGDLLEELRRSFRDIGDVRFEVARYEPGPTWPPDWGLYGVLAEILGELDPGCVPVPLLAAGATDARHFARLGIQTYGFVPGCPASELAAGEAGRLLRTMHGPNERIPATALRFGAAAVHEALRRFGEARS